MWIISWNIYCGIWVGKEVLSIQDTEALWFWQQGESVKMISCNSMKCTCFHYVCVDLLDNIESDDDERLCLDYTQGRMHLWKFSPLIFVYNGNYINIFCSLMLLYSSIILEKHLYFLFLSIMLLVSWLYNRSTDISYKGYKCALSYLF